ncbi:alpha/beta fold hydrolase [Pseudomaricurvus alkylphenolicus]|uniref:alpha/beta fold hydrolase n=1 Tax=Pseudomaricurvus alkylphenolicus TaxID=1306991 RepID=UPI0014217C50|nr:alpha/beta hydrolase [Pseudomaricurvus alkylphenolicus]NIB40528.1 alpha/beta fold hydrolase [Pseudomaricurvus alkylphenolicus]
MNQNDPEIGYRINANGIETNYLDQGEGQAIILLHGSGAGVTAYANWRLTIPGLAKSFRVVAPDVAGFGYTERKPGIDYHLDFWVDHIAGLMDALDIEQAHFVGNSFGGALTLALAARYPERVGRFVLMGSVGTEFELTEGLDQAWGYEPSIENMQALMESFAYHTEFISDELVRSRYEASVRPGYQESFASLFPAPRQRHIGALATPEAALKSLPHQVLIVHGRDDRIIPLASSLKLHQLIEHSDLHVFGECGHWTQIEKKAEFSKLIEEFFSR